MNVFNIYFSVIICCYNSEKYIEETIDSVINQSYKNWEIIIIDDGSTDNTRAIIKKFKNKNIFYFYQKNKGFASARNLAIKKSNYDWIAIIDHDDICLNNRLEIHKNQIIKNKDCKFFFADTEHFNSNNEILRRNFDIFDMDKINLNKKSVCKSLLIEGCFIDSESVVFSKIESNKIKGFNENYKYLADYDFFYRMGNICNFNMSKDIVSKWRVHEKQATNLLQSTYKQELFIFYLKNIFSFHTNVQTKFELCIRIIRALVKKILKL